MTGGLQLKHTYCAANRQSLAKRDGYKSAQGSSAATFYALAPIGLIDASLWTTFVRYGDRQSGTSFSASTIDGPLDYLERRLTLHARLAYVPERGIRADADYFLDHCRFLRDADRMNQYLMFLPWSPNGRFAVHVGYQFSRQSYFLIGAAYDAGGDPFYEDGRGPVRYDGGLGRIVVTW